MTARRPIHEVLLLVIAALLLGGCAAMQEDGGREFDATWPDVADSSAQRMTARSVYPNCDPPARSVAQLPGSM